MGMSESEIISRLGPLSILAGTWEGAKGDDIAPGDDRGSENNKFKEVMTFRPFGPVNNHEQELFGLHYTTKAWRLSEADAFHEEVGYWLWDAKEKQVMRCFLVPRGIALIAGGTVEPKSTSFSLAAELGSATYGICSNRFLDREFQTVRFEYTITIHNQNSFSYAEDTQLKMKGKSDIFHHRDQNSLTRMVERHDL